MASHDEIVLHAETELKLRQRQADQLAEFTKRSERLISSIPKKRRIERARAVEDFEIEKERLLARMAKERQELGIPLEDFNNQVSIPVNSQPRNVGSNAHTDQNEPRKLSRGARRRQKKAYSNAEAQRRILEEKATMGVTSRQREIEAIQNQLMPKLLRIHNVSPDGHCMYSAVAHQMLITNLEAQIPKSVDGLREATANHMLEHREEYAPYIAIEEGSRDGFAHYCEQLRSQAVWGGQVELRAIADILGIPIQVYAADLPVVQMGNDTDCGTVLRVSFHRNYYQLGEHYNSVVPQSMD